MGCFVVTKMRCSLWKRKVISLSLSSLLVIMITTTEGGGLSSSRFSFDKSCKWFMYCYFRADIVCCMLPVCLSDSP